MATSDKDFKVKNGLVVTNGGSFGGTVTVATPVNNDDAATKQYVDTYDPFPSHDTDDLSEGGTNLYFTNERAQDAVGNSLGTGLAYNDGTGAISVDSTIVNTSSSAQTKTGNFTAAEVHATTKLVAETVGGDEGGEILLGKAQTNTTLDGTGITIDVYQNRLRFFEQGGSARGYYIDMTGGGSGATTNLVGSGSASNSFTTISTPSGTSPVADSSTDTLTLSAGTGITITGDSSTDTITIATTGLAPTSSPTITNPTISGLYLSDSSIVFEGSSGDANETTLTVTNPTADRTITIPDVTGTIITTGDSGTVTNTMLSGSISNDKLTNSTISGVSLGSNLNALTIGTGLTGTSYNGSSAVTVAIDSTVATLTGSQTLTNKTISLGSNSLSGTTSDFNSALSDGDFATLAGTETLTNKTMGATTFTGAVTLPSDPSSALHAATKQYVDAATTGLNVHESVRAATTANINISTALENGDVLDGITLATGNRVLVKNQSTASENGVYVVQSSGAAIRAEDYNSAGEVDAGDFIFVQAGTVNGKTGWVQTNTITTVDSDAIEFTQFSGAGTYLAGNGLTLLGSTFSIDTSITVDKTTAQTLTNKTISAANNTLTIATTDITGVTASAAELNILDGAMLDVNELNILNGLTASTAELNILDGATLTTTELNYVDGVTSSIQTQLDGKAASSHSHTLSSITDVTASAAELNILDGATLSTTELNYVDGVTSAIQTQIDGKISASSSDTLTNKTIDLTSNTLSGTTAQFNSALSDGDFATLAGGETLTNKTLTSPTITTPTLTLSSTTSTTSGRIAFDATADKLYVGDGATAVEFASSTIAINPQTASYTLVLTDKDKLVEVSNASAVTVSVPTNTSVAFPVGTQITILQTGAGQVTISATTPATTTLNSTPGNKLRAQWSSATLIKRATDTWVLVGDLTA